MSTTITLTGIRIRTALVPLKRPLATRVGRFTQGPFLIIDLETRGGVPGRVLGFTFSRHGLQLVPPILQVFVDLLKGRQIHIEELGDIFDECQKAMTLLGHEGVTQMALSMLDMAVHDAMARTAGLPLYRMLSGRSDQIPAYNSCGLGLLEPDAAAREATELASEHGGYRHIKMRLGRPSIREDITAIRAIRDAVGPDLLVSADFNQGLDCREALASCLAVDGEALAWIEEPVVYDDYPTQALLARKLRTPLQIGENWWSWRVGKSAIEAGAADYIMPDILRIGGVTGWMRLARVAQAWSIPVSSHLSPEYSAHVLAATPTAHWLEYMDWGQDLLTEPLIPVHGYARPNETPGAGVDWNERAVAKVLVAN